MSTMLHVAVSYGILDMAKMLVKNANLVNSKDRVRMQTEHTNVV